jgi:hypothetical protein
MLVYTLLADGSSDQVLMPILNWLLARHGVTTFRGRWGDLRGVRPSPGRLSDRISTVLDLYPCDLLFIHRDAEGMLLETRRAEILDAISEVADLNLPAICVVPVRMQEVWLLLEEPAIRKAAGNPNGRERLSLPRLDDLESLRDPKAVLHTFFTRRADFLVAGNSPRKPAPTEFPSSSTTSHRSCGFLGSRAWTPIYETTSWRIPGTRFPRRFDIGLHLTSFPDKTRLFHGTQ